MTQYIHCERFDPLPVSPPPPGRTPPHGGHRRLDPGSFGGVPDSVGKALEEAGFRREGRHWIHSNAQLFVEFPGSAVQEHETTARVEIDGIRVLTLSPEDLIIDRLAAWQFWRSTTDGASAFSS